MLSPTKYCRLEWKIQDFTRENLKVQKTLNSQKFDMVFGCGKLRWCLQFQTKAERIIETGNINMVDEELHLDNQTQSITIEELNINDESCGILLSLLESSSTETLEFKNSLLNLRIHVVNADQDEKLIYCGLQHKLKLYGTAGSEGQWGRQIGWNQFFDEKNKFISNETLTLTVLMEIHVRDNDGDANDEPLRPFDNLLNSAFFSDFSIVCNDREIPVHRVILYTFSPTFFKMLQDQMTISNSNKVIIDDIDGKVVSKILQYIYTGQLETLQGVNDKELLYGADKFEITNLKKKIINSISLQLNMKNVFETLQLADRYNEEVLMRNCIVLIKMQLKKLSKSIGSINIDQKLLVKIIEKVMMEPNSSFNKLRAVQL